MSEKSMWIALWSVVAVVVLVVVAPLDFFSSISSHCSFHWWRIVTQGSGCALLCLRIEDFASHGSFKLNSEREYSQR